MLGLNRNNVVLSTYNSGWELAFQDEKKSILDKFGNKVVAVEHVGSTAIPGMSAKPVLDFMVAIESLDNYKSFVEPLRELGYEFRREYLDSQQHVLFVKGSEDFRTHYLKLTELNSEFWEEHILFRDYLISHREVAEEYKQLKEKLQVSNASSRATYTELKSEFIQNVLRLARQEK